MGRSTFFALAVLLAVCGLGAGAVSANPPDSIAPRPERAAVGTPGVRGTASPPARIGAFNVQWLERPSFRDDYRRSERDYRDLAAIIRTHHRFDLVGLAEVTGREPVERLLRHLPAYDAVFIGEGRESQHLAVLYRTDRVELIDAYEEETIRAGNPYLRPGLVVRARIGEFDFQVMVVHLKAFDDAEARRTRLRQARAIEDWISRQFADPRLDNDVILMGDFNTTPGSMPLREIAREQGRRRMIWLSRHFDPGDTTHPSSGARLDNLAVAAGYTLRPGGGEYIPGSANVLRLHDRFSGYHRRLSDHLPVGAAFRTGFDDD